MPIRRLDFSRILRPARLGSPLASRFDDPRLILRMARAALAQAEAEQDPAVGRFLRQRAANEGWLAMAALADVVGWNLFGWERGSQGGGLALKRMEGVLGIHGELTGPFTTARNSLHVRGAHQGAEDVLEGVYLRREFAAIEQAIETAFARMDEARQRTS